MSAHDISTLLLCQFLCLKEQCGEIVAEMNLHEKNVSLYYFMRKKYNNSRLLNVYGNQVVDVSTVMHG